MTPYQERAKDLRKKIIGMMDAAIQRRDFSVRFDDDMDSVIAAALLAVREETLKECAEVADKIDVLKIVCDWEEGDGIAYAVQKHIVNALLKERQKGE